MGAERITLEVTKAHCLGGGRNVEVGEVLHAPGDCSVEEAGAKVRREYAKVIPNVTTPPLPEEDAAGGAGTPATGDPEEISTGDPTPVTRDPAAAKEAGQKPASKGGKKGSGKKK